MSYPEQQLLSGFNNQNVMNDKEKAIVYRNYFDRYTQLTAMLTGFQSFVMTMDTVEEVNYLPMLLVSVSFLGNMFVCFISIIGG